LGFDRERTRRPELALEQEIDAAGRLVAPLHLSAAPMARMFLSP
jgi:hypothetical protein